MFLMSKNIPVLEIQGYHVDVLNNRLLPHYLKRIDTISDRLKRYDLFREFLAGRTITLNRSNSKWILNHLRLSQSMTLENRFRIALFCRAVSLEDSFWVKRDGEESLCWEDVNLRHNPLHESLSLLALHSIPITLVERNGTPELTTGGSYAKGWRREGDRIYLYKRNGSLGNEVLSEIEVSNILDKCNVRHVKYELVMDYGEVCSKCELMTTDKLSRISFSDLVDSYSDALDIALKLDSETIYKMCIIDYLVSNCDRHFGNWGFYYDSDTLELLECHPLFDHNLAFALNGEESEVFEGMTLKEVAIKGLKEIDFHFTAIVTRSDFYVQQHYELFKERMHELGLQEVE